MICIFICSQLCTFYQTNVFAVHLCKTERHIIRMKCMADDITIAAFSWRIYNYNYRNYDENAKAIIICRKI